MSALAFDFTYDVPPAAPRAALVPAGAAAAPVPSEDGVAAAPAPRRRLYAVRGTVGELQAAVVAPAPVPALRAVPAPTLDDILGQTWSALASGISACPVCHEETMAARWTAGHGLAGGRCASCGTAIE